ncbi:Lpp/OprI family alanine-zipper lipoprotein [Thaumasiovibrio subtropicus]|uniref:Lpp/OprI family alanine-zipper lipoprotein n=1 Tax=Thaumasiovibrio subtropicus TaxID=1891207 RepID=UPI000B35848F|nr:Lpp/OprI family alanine-zipper lipoprotein [Thaumasiovibrio subtropicus]
MKKTLSVLSIAALTMFMVGCSSSPQAEMETDEIKELTKQIEMLSQQVQSLERQQRDTRSAVQSMESTADAAMKEAMRANQRIDNVPSSYTK